MVIKQCVRISFAAAYVEFRIISAHGRRLNPLGHRERDSVARGRRTIDEVRRSLAISTPSTRALNIGEGFSASASATHYHFDWRCRGSAAVVPCFNHGVVSSRTQGQACTQL